MKQAEFEARYRAQWKAFAALLVQLESKKSEKNPTADSAEHFTQHYRRLCQLLSIAKQRYYSAQLIEELNQLALRGHQQLYQHNHHFGRALATFVAQTFPRTVRREWRFFLLAALLLYLPAFFAGWLTYHDALLVYSIFSPEQVESFAQMYDPDAAHVGRPRDADTDVAMFGYYIMNNVGIGFRTFAAGLLFGLGSIFFLVYNGVVFGAVAGYLTFLGFSSTFYPFVCGHGAFELTAIVLSGAAGLKLGWAMVAPGPYLRITALKRAARTAINMVYGMAAMLVIAAFIEAFWSSSAAISQGVKYTVAGFLWAAVMIYFLVVGRVKGVHKKELEEQNSLEEARSGSC